MSKSDLKAIVWKEGIWYVAKALGLEIASQGKTRKEAVSNLQEAIDLFFEDENTKISNYQVPDDPRITALYA